MTAAETAAPPKTEITISLEAVQGQVARFDHIGAGLEALERLYPKNLVVDFATPAGMEQAIEARRAWREPRIALEHARKAAKAPVLELGKTIDRVAGDIEDKLRAGEDHYDDQIKAEEARKEQIRELKRQAEAERIAAIRRRIVEIFATVKTAAAPGARPTVAMLHDVRARIELSPVDDSFGDLKIEAQETKVQTLALLDERIAEQRAFEDEQADLARQREALAEERRKEAAAAEERRAAEAKQRAEEDAERERVRLADAEALRLAQEETARQQAQIDAQRAELDRREAEARERDRVAQEAQIAASNRAAAEEAARRRADEEEAERSRTARARANEQVEAAAWAMLDCLRQWKAGEDLAEKDGDESEVINARTQRDALVFNLQDCQP